MLLKPEIYLLSFIPAPSLPHSLFFFQKTYFGGAQPRTGVCGGTPSSSLGQMKGDTFIWCGTPLRPAAEFLPVQHLYCLADTSMGNIFLVLCWSTNAETCSVLLILFFSRKYKTLLFSTPTELLIKGFWMLLFRTSFSLLRADVQPLPECSLQLMAGANCQLRTVWCEIWLTGWLGVSGW